MGIGASLPEGSSPRPDGIKQLNESVWELYRSEGVDVPEVEVIFFHGLQLSDYKEAFWKTWLSRDEKEVWPSAWLGPSLQNVRISSVSYDSSARQTDCNGTADMYQIVGNLMHDVVLSPNFSIDQNATVILVGHSLGGLIIKQLLLKCLDETGRLSPDDIREARRKERIETFVRNCRGVFYYSTPHGGSELVAYAEKAKFVPGANVNMPIIKFLRVLSSETSRINNAFGNVRKRRLSVATRAMGELYDTNFAGLSRRVVPEASARLDVDEYYSAQANHFEVCKAENNQVSGIFRQLRDFCITCATEEALDLGLPTAPTHTPLPTVPSHAPTPEEPLPAAPTRNLRH